MIKGINKLVIEINNTEDDFFDKAILFVNPDKAYSSKAELDINVKRYIKNLKSPSDKINKKSSIALGVKLACAVSIGATLGGTLVKLL